MFPQDPLESELRDLLRDSYCRDATPLLARPGSDFAAITEPLYNRDATTSFCWTTPGGAVDSPGKDATTMLYAAIQYGSALACSSKAVSQGTNLPASSALARACADE